MLLGLDSLSIPPKLMPWTGCEWTFQSIPSIPPNMSIVDMCTEADFFVSAK